MMPKEQIERWLATLPAETEVSIDDGGLSLITQDGSGACLEVGGTPEWYLLQYVCPGCGHEWTDEWDCACDDDCPECGMRHISPTSWNEIVEQ